MTTTTQAVAATALQTAVAFAQALAVTNPKLAAALALEPLLAQLVESVVEMQQAGTLTPEALAAKFVSIGTGLQPTHDKWVALNAAAAAPAP
jgi:hypothetical protein